ncbi:MAG: translation elongation factor Ts [Bacteroidota bacterium]|nr:translation elongation factor Ts [Bacteroidota bacterium]
MAKISAKEVNELRKRTGVGMMDCKKALQEAEGDFDKAIEILRKKGQKLANKRADRSANEGYVIAKASQDGKFAAMMMLNCETDFVAKNSDFVAFANKLIDIAIVNKAANLDEFKAIKLDDKTVSEAVIEMVGRTGEKLELSAYNSLSAESVAVYNHQGNRLASILSMNIPITDAIVKVGHEVAMQIAAMNPAGLDESDVPAEILEKELEIGREQARKEGKPEQIIEKIAQGKLNKFLKENTLVNQESIREAKTSVKDYLKKTDKDLAVTKFFRLELGE